MLLFLIQSHRNPAQISQLVATLRTGCPGSHVVISHDDRSPPLDPAMFGNDDRVHLTTGRGGRGDFLIVDGYLSALKFIRDRGIDFEWLVNLSGSDYPVSSLRTLSEELAATGTDGFLHHFDVLKEDPREMAPMFWPQGHGRDRYYFQYRKLSDTLSATQRKVLAAPRIAMERLSLPYRLNTAYGLLVGREARQAPFSTDFRCYAGSYWHTLRRKCCDYLLDFAQEKPGIVDYFRHVLIPDEAFFQTVLVNNRAFNFTNDNRRFYDMRGSRHGHPKVLREADLPEFTTGAYFFARKIEAESGESIYEKLNEIALA